MRTHQTATITTQRLPRAIDVRTTSTSIAFAPAPERAEALGHRFQATSGEHAGAAVVQRQGRGGKNRKKQKARKRRQDAALRENAENYDTTLAKLRAETALRNIPSEHVRRQLEEGIEKIKRLGKGKARKHGTKLVARLGKAYGIRHAPDQSSYDPDLTPKGETLAGKYVKLGPRAFRETIPYTGTAVGKLRNLQAASTLGHETLHSLYARRVGSMMPSTGRAGMAVAKTAEQEHQASVKRLKLAQAAVSKKNLVGKLPHEVEQMRQQLRDRKREHREAREAFHQARNLGKRLTVMAKREGGFEEGLAHQQNLEHQRHFRERAYGEDGPPPEEAATLDAMTSESRSVQARHLSSLTEEQQSLFHAGRYGEALAQIRKKVDPAVLEEFLTRAK